mmetsp:Transcript_14519/g.23079  ORF Transcript_14519/g.23079 Transcript_14519/m.23079 type:complete len:124 (-) Transcript_14519:39-410(-)
MHRIFEGDPAGQLTSSHLVTSTGTVGVLPSYASACWRIISSGTEAPAILMNDLRLETSLIVESFSAPIQCRRGRHRAALRKDLNFADFTCFMLALASLDFTRDPAVAWARRTKANGSKRMSVG